VPKLGAVTISTQRRGLNDSITKFWSFAAPAYNQRCLQRWVYRPAQDEVLETLRSRGSERVADIACGTGILADRIDRELRPDEIYGLDMSDGMLAQARQRSDRIRWMKAPAEELPFADDFLDAVVTTSAFHFFDQPAALREFRRVLAPGGLMAVTTISPRQPMPLQRLTADLRNPAYSPSPKEMRTLVEDAGFEIVDQHRVRRPLVTQFLTDLITVGAKA
jgi:ubiquinone/menaquinone biosynthesis C-methylase UbiE